MENTPNAPNAPGTPNTKKRPIIYWMCLISMLLCLIFFTIWGIKYLFPVLKAAEAGLKYPGPWQEFLIYFLLNYASICAAAFGILSLIFRIIGGKALKGIMR